MPREEEIHHAKLGYHQWMKLEQEIQKIVKHMEIECIYEWTVGQRRSQKGKKNLIPGKELRQHTKSSTKEEIMAIHIYIKKGQIFNEFLLTLHFKGLENNDKSISKLAGRKKIIKIRAWTKFKHKKMHKVNELELVHLTNLNQ